ncbi:hypothetical protein [Tautonia plasticadhaerens]|uniref:Uncharacterized protein n=1 Tax=Tautonia plasticadhaerens TaxID=2527974 RepID=A0A518GUI1_9BACT|nr:hypothetical protein [Tautonia plasticadhaerens]QDV32250.1 hypothetical protein ElP_00730 [Tautonia plasticadhaerens]
MPENDYRLILFDQPDDPQALRELFRGVMGLHPTEAMQWVKRAPGILPWPLAEGEVRELLDALYEQGIAAEARRVDTVPKLVPPRSVHRAAVKEDGLSVGGLRGEPAHWVPWAKLELIHGARIAAEDEFRDPRAPGWSGTLAAGLNAMILRGPRASRARRASRVVKEPTTELHLVRQDPLIAFRVVADQMNYSDLGDRLKPSAAENFPVFLADILGRVGGRAHVTDSARALLDPADDREPTTYPNSQAMLDATTLRLLWAWYRRDREVGGAEQA